jgi:hypothetical protein
MSRKSNQTKNKNSKSILKTFFFPQHYHFFAFRTTSRNKTDILKHILKLSFTSPFFKIISTLQQNNQLKTHF